MRAVVTGGAGFVGSHLIEALITRGDEVMCIERPGAARHWIRGLPIAWSDSGISDVEVLTRLFEGADVVFHLAALTEAKTPEDCYAVNTEGTARVVRAAAALGVDAPRVVFMSSLAAAGPCRGGECLGAETIPYPLSVYGHSKLLAEAVIHAYQDRVPATILRLPAIYGPRERAALKMFRMVARGIAVTVGNWNREISLIYVADAVDGLIAAGTCAQAVGRTYCLSYPESVTWTRFAELVGKALGRTPRLISVPVSAARLVARVIEECARLKHSAAILNRDRVREISQRRWVCDPAPAMAEIRFRPTYPVEAGVPATAAWYREEGWL